MGIPWVSHGYPMVSQIHWLIIIFPFFCGKCPSSPLARRCVHQPSWKQMVAPAGIRWMLMFWERFKRETLGVIWCNTPNSTNIQEFLLGVYCLLFLGGVCAQGLWFMRLRILRMVMAMAPYPQSFPTRNSKAKTGLPPIFSTLEPCSIRNATVPHGYIPLVL